MIKIEKNVPLPNRFNSKKGRRRKYPFPDMKKGDSFKVRAKPGKVQSVQSSIGKSASEWKKSSGNLKVKFATSKVSPAIVRCWRIK